MEQMIEGKLPFAAWGTKGFEFWTFLSVLLHATRPRALLEVGCGRSSTFFADYAFASNAAYVGIENNGRWFKKTRLDIDLLGFSTRHLVHVPLSDDGSWYNLDQFRAATGDPGRFDFALIDGPNERQFFAGDAEISRYFDPEDGNPFGHRDNPDGLEAIKSVTRDCEVMMVDDVHKHHLFLTVDRMLAEPGEYEKHYFIYKPHPAMNNALCICLKRNSSLAKMLPGILDFLGMKLERNYSPEDAQGSFRRLLSAGAAWFTKT